MNDYQLALQLQAQYDGQIPLRTVSGITYSRIDDSIEGITLLFRGTSDWHDAIRDLEAEMIDCPFGRVHAGAWEGMQAVLDAENLPTDDTVIQCIGHSLGAMRAQLAYRELFRRGYQHLKCVTFECPRWGDLAANNYASDLVQNRTYQNYKNMLENDGFTMIPLHLLLEPYHSVTNCHRFWSAPTPDNEWHDAPLNVQAHSLSDCVIPYLKTLCATSSSISAA